mgnify:FL=1
MRPKPHPSVFILACLLGAGQSPCAWAQNSVPVTELSDDIEEVVVTARRREGSGGGRRTAATREQLDRSDQTGMEGFFDEIDGLSTLGDDGQGNSFSIDGMSADLGKVTINGQGVGEGRGNGGFAAGDLPPDMIRRVEVLKMPSAAMEEGGSAGSVNLQLRNPVTITAHSVSGKARLGYVPDDGNFNPSASLFSGGPSEGRKFGYMFNATLSQDTREYASQDVSRWLYNDFDGQHAWYPGQLRNNEVKDRRTDGFAGLTLGFRPHEDLLLSANLFLSRKERDISNHGLQHRFEKQRDLVALGFDGRIVSELESSDKSRSNLRISASAREDRVDSIVLGASAIWRLEKWRLNGALGYSADKNESLVPTRSATFAANNAFGYRARSDGGLVSRVAGFAPISDFELGRVNLQDRATEDGTAFGSVDAVRSLSDEFFRRLRIGWKSRESERERLSASGRVNSEGEWRLDDFFTGRYRQTPWDSTPWPSGDIGLVDAYIGDKEISWEENLLNEFDMDRRTDAAYAQLDFRADRDERRLLSGNLGVRVVDTETRIDGYRQDGESLAPFSQLTDYTDYLPSAYVRARIADRIFLTLGAARVMTHPAFNDLAPGVRIKYSDKTARSGNPDLEPFRANQYLSELTWGGNGLRLALNLVYRDVKTYFALGEETLEIDDDLFLVTRPVNGENGSLLTAGFALDQNLARLDQRLQGYSAAFSWVYNHSRTEMKDPLTGATLPLPNTAEHVAKADLVYARKSFSGKLSYQWRGEALKASVSESGLSVWNQPFGSLNLNLGWKFKGGLRFNLDARNLLAEEQVQSSDDDGQIWRITERDRTIAVTIQAKW